MSNLKLGVDVVSAHDLVPKDGQDSSGVYVELQFEGQKFRTTMKEKDLSPVWNESFYFNITNPSNLRDLTLHAHVYNLNKATDKKSSLGKVSLTGTSFVPYSDAVVLHYPLEKQRIWSRVQGELGLKVFITDDHYMTSSNPLHTMQSAMNVNPRSAEPILNPFSDERAESRAESRRTFRHLPNSDRRNQNDDASAEAPLPKPKSGSYEMRSGPQPPNIVHTYAGPLPMQPGEYSVKETSPYLGGGRIVGGRVIPAERPNNTYDLVEKMQYLFVRVVKARDLPAKDLTGSLDPYVEVRVGNYKGTTKYFEKKQNPEWNEVFAFAKDQVQTSVLEVVVMDKDLVMDDFVGLVRLDLYEIPTRVPPDSPLAPEWYRLEEMNGEKKKKGELMLAVWYGTQADEAFPDAWHSDATSATDPSSAIYGHTRGKVYHSPKLWYVRVVVLEAQDLLVSDKGRFPDAYVKVQIGNQVFRTKPVQARNMNPVWREEMLFVTAEPFEDHLILSVEDRLASDKEETIGKVIVPLSEVHRRADDKMVRSRWFNLSKSTSAAMDADAGKKDKFYSRLHLQVCLEGGYHVLDESTNYCTDLRPTAKPLWKNSIGVLELGILNAEGLHPMKTKDGKGTSDTYCVAKYGQKWVRTRTIINSLSPKYNEQYTWEVYDTATVLVVGVFDNSQINGGSSSNKDVKIGKIRIRLSTLETGRVYTHSYPLLALHSSGVKKMGELHLAIRFSCTSLLNMMYIYSRPLLPKMHYIRPLTPMQLDLLRHQAVNLVAARLSRAEPPLKREVVEYMSDAHSHLWSMRRSKANFFRLMSVFAGLFAFGKWFGEVCKWKNPVTTILVHILFGMLVLFPELILPTAFLYMFIIGLWNYRYRPRHPPHMNTRISYADAVHPDELDEEFDTFPTTRSPAAVRYRYDRLRSVAGKVQTVVGDLASQGERIQALLSWRDPRATVIFILFCLVAAIVLYATPFQVVAIFVGAYVMRHPRLRHKVPSAPINFFKRLPAQTDSML
ncbi:FT-interacting protein 7-like [Syzygium oleosum]|uniref:FT-interacting protein 7-like n=1 Tax=Syzygium oleosum TaxID=219896 RepID=UPI0011D23B54|nr:FT-interacting protein 7-like [Syzygium oleosum]